MGPPRPGDPGPAREQRRRAGAQARVEVLPNAGHFPHKDHPHRFAKIVHDFVRTTQPAAYTRVRWRSLLKNGQVGAGQDATVTSITSA